MVTKVISLVDQIKATTVHEAKTFGGLQVILKSQEAIDAVLSALKVVADKWDSYDEYDRLCETIDGRDKSDHNIYLCEDSDVAIYPGMTHMLKSIDVYELLTDAFGLPELENSPIVSLGFGQDNPNEHWSVWSQEVEVDKDYNILSYIEY